MYPLMSLIKNSVLIFYSRLISDLRRRILRADSKIILEAIRWLKPNLAQAKALITQNGLF